MKEFKTEINGIKAIKDLGMQYATETSASKVRMAYFECKDCGAAYKSVYYRPATRCKHCTNSHLKAKVNTKFKIADGTIFTNLIVVKEVDPIKSDNNASRKCYEVKCTCGNYFITTGTGLRLGRITECSSCACKKRPQSTRKYAQEERMFKKAIEASAKSRNIPWDLTVEDYINIATKHCYYCGTEPVPSTYLTRKDETPIPVNGLDRQDNSLGYTLSNVVSCCSICNSMKNTMSVKSFLLHINKIMAHNKTNQNTKA